MTSPSPDPTGRYAAVMASIGHSDLEVQAWRPCIGDPSSTQLASVWYTWWLDSPATISNSDMHVEATVEFKRRNNPSPNSV
jgi:hypothetical protein